MLRSDKDAEIPFPPRNFLSIRALALALLLPLLLACESESDETDREMEALVALYNATGGPDWEWNDNWLSDKPLGEWAGVVTDANGRVIRLDLGYNGLGGEIPPELGSLGSVVNCIFPSIAYFRHSLFPSINPYFRHSRVGGNPESAPTVWYSVPNLSGSRLSPE